MTTQPRDILIAWLGDAYAMEGQAVELLERELERLDHYPEIRTNNPARRAGDGGLDWEAAAQLTEQCLQRSAMGAGAKR